MASFAICDGARPGTKKRDAVLRSVIRRAVRFGYQYFDRRAPFAPEKAHRLKSLGSVKPSDAEVRANPRSRSAVMRVAERTEVAA
jgi:16S rRNA (cytosine1402-N4)-methyltransferase